MTGSHRWPHQTGHRRPDQRKVYIWPDMRVTYPADFAARNGWEIHPWRWCCMLCEPPAFGHRVKLGAYEAILRHLASRHFPIRAAHHAWAARHPIGGHPE